MYRRLACSSRHSAELRCQNADCAAVLVVSAIPPDAEAYLREIVTILSPRDLVAFSGELGLSVADAASYASGNAAVSEPALERARASILAAFRDVSAAGDAMQFAALIGRFCSGPSGASLPLCDPCMRAALTAAERSHALAFQRRDEAFDAAERIVSLSGPAALACAATPGRAAAVTAIEEALAQEEAALLTEISKLRKRRRQQRRAAATLDALDRAVCERLTSAVALGQRDIGGIMRSTRERMADLRDRDVRARAALSSLRMLSVHNDAFFIWHSGPFVTINGCRLGRLPGQSVGNAEINAALGQVALLLAHLSQRLGFVFRRHRVIPMGSHSKIASLDDPRGTGVMHELALAERSWAGWLTAQRPFNAALKALLCCLAELGEYAQSLDRSFWWPYPITHGGERIADLPVALGSKEAQWTRAMKCTLTNLKWLLAWAFRQRE